MGLPVGANSLQSSRRQTNSLESDQAQLLCTAIIVPKTSCWQTIAGAWSDGAKTILGPFYITLDTVSIGLMLSCSLGTKSPKANPRWSSGRVQSNTPAWQGLMILLT